MRYLCRFDPNEQFRISQISLSSNDKHLIVATSQDARQNKRQSRCHPKHETVYGGSCAKGRSVTFETHGLAYAKKLEHNTSLPHRSSVGGMHRRTFAAGDGTPSKHFLGKGMLVYT